MAEQKIAFYTGPAGGWGALNSVKNALLHHGIAVKGAKTLLSANQSDGFDCPGCAWPDRNHASSFEFCENGAKAVAAEATARRAGPELFAQYTVAELAEQSDFWLEGQGRLTHPLAYDAASDQYRPIAWDAAFALVARHLKALPDPNQAVFYTSGRTSNEAAFLYQLFVRQFGTNNFPDCSNLCHESSGSAMKPQIGVGKGTVQLADFEQADAIFIFGQNPGTNHPRMLGELRAGYQRGARIASFNPLRERGLERFADPQSTLEMATLGSTPISTHYFQLRVGGDLPAVKGIMKHVLEQEGARGGVLDHAFIAEHTTGFGALAASLRAEAWAVLEEESGLTEAQMRAAGDLYIGADRVIACWGMGITQHKYAVHTVQAIVSLLLLRGNIGRPGAGPCPVRGHSNVQGDRTMGIWEKPPAALLDRLQQVFDFDPPRTHGVDVVASVQGSLELRSYDARRKRLELNASLSDAQQAFQMATQLVFLAYGDVLQQACIDDPALADAQTLTLARQGLAHYFAGALLLPYAPFLQAARESRYDVEWLQRRFGVSFESVCHRLSTLQRSGARGVPIYLIRVDQAGNVSKRQSANSLHFARHGGTCPLWHVFEAFVQPGRILTQVAEMPDGTRYFGIARSVQRGGGSFAAPRKRFAFGIGCELSQAHELVYADGWDLQQPREITPIGPGCRVCPRTDCMQRAFPPAGKPLHNNDFSESLVSYRL